MDPTMRWLSTDPSEFGIISVGQHAHGFFAFGQMARGVVAIGQLAIGVVAVGQLSLSIVGVGQVGGGVAWFAGMLGVGGRGICLRLIPGLDLPRRAPNETPLAEIWQGRARGFVRLGVTSTPQGPALVSGGQILDIKLRPQVAWALANALGRDGLREIFAFLGREGDVVVCDRLVEVPGQRKGAIPLWLNVVRFVALAVLATVWCYLFDEAVLNGAEL